MESFFLQRGSRQLFCAYHPPVRERLRPEAILLCSPSGRAQQRADSGWPLLAAGFAAAGHPCLRFDYSGTGDSGGDDRDWDLTIWMEDLRAAARELAGGSGADCVVPIGLGVGANLAMRAPASESPWERLVAWNPVADGRRHLQDLALLDALWRRAKNLPPASSKERRSGEWLGFPHSRALREQMAALRLHSPLPRARRWLLLVNDPGDAAGCAADLPAAARPDRALNLPEASAWTARGELFEAAADARPVVAAVTAWLAEREA